MVGLSMPASAATLRAPSSSASQIVSCQVLATIASVSVRCVELWQIGNARASAQLGLRPALIGSAAGDS